MNKKIFKRAVVGFMVAAMMMTVTGGAAPKTASAAVKKAEISDMSNAKVAWKSQSTPEKQRNLRYLLRLQGKRLLQ